MSSGAPIERAVSIPAGPAGKVVLAGDLRAPASPRGAVLFAHGSGSSRLSPRNRSVAAALNRAGFATLLFDLLTEEEEAVDQATGHLRFEVDLLARRLGQASDWLRRSEDTSALALGYFGASTGAAAALIATAGRADVRAIVSRGGRPDLAGAALDAVRAPTLLIVGGDDTHVITLNRTALARLRADKELVLVPGATHLFEEPGALEQVAELATRWFDRYLAQDTATGVARVPG